MPSPTTTTTTIAAAVRELDTRKPQLPASEAARVLESRLGRPVSRQAVQRARARSNRPAGRPPTLGGELAVRFPPPLSRRLARAARQQGRSVRALVIELCERGLGRGEPPERWSNGW